MSTRMQIKVDGNDGILIYQHSDGYPEGVLKTLLPFIASFRKYRGDDPEYLTAQLVGHLIAEQKRSHREFIETMLAKNPNDTYYKKQLDEPSYIGFGLDCNVHGDIAYFYVIERDGTVVVQRPKYTKGYEIRGFKTLMRVKLGTSVEDALASWKRLQEKLEAKAAKAA